MDLIHQPLRDAGVERSRDPRNPTSSFAQFSLLNKRRPRIPRLPGETSRLRSRQNDAHAVVRLSLRVRRDHKPALLGANLLPGARRARIPMRLVLFGFGLLLVASPTSAGAQNVSLLSPKTTADTSKTQVAIPAGATASVSNTSADAGPIFGFQVWNEQKQGFLGAFFTFSVPKTISGTQKDFGNFLLDPPSGGTSFYISGSQALTQLHWGGSVGVAGRAGVTSATWEASPNGTDTSESSFVAYVNPNLLLASKTFQTNADPSSTPNEYQLGIETGPSWRFIGGNVSQDGVFRASPQVLGTRDKHMFGWETTVFVRLNAFQPYVRFSYFKRRSDGDVLGFTGFQAVFNVNVLSAIFQTSTGGSD